MRRFIFQSILNFLAVLIVYVVLTLFYVVLGADISSTTLAQAFTTDSVIFLLIAVFALLLTVVNWFLRPALVMIFGGWVLRSFGAFIILLDIFLFFLALLFSPYKFPIPQPQVLWIVFAGVLFNLTSFVLGTVFGLNRPEPDGASNYAKAWKQMERLPSFRRSSITENLRLQEVYTTLLNYGIEIALTDTPVGRFRQGMTRLLNGKPSPLDDAPTAVKIRIMLQQLGPTYVKFGQMASGQSQTLPHDWNVELAKLQSNVPPVPYTLAREVIVKELGKPPEELYASFDQQAMAAASTAQVHRATLFDGTPVAVKIQRPNIVAMVKADLGILQDVSNVLENLSSYARDLDLLGIVTEFADGVIRELDYRNEAYHAARLADNMQMFPTVHVPTIYPDLSAERVMTMEFVKGVKVNKPGALDDPNIDRTALTETFVRALVKQIFIDGFFHGDPHPGNIYINPQTRILTYLDLGLMGRLDQTKRLDLIDLLVSFSQMDSASLANLALRLSKKMRPLDGNAFREDMNELMNQFVRYNSRASFEKLISEFFGLLQRYGLRLDKQFTLAIKAVVQSQAVVMALGGLVDFVPFAVNEIQALALKEITQDKVLGTVKQQVTAVGKELLRRVPNLQDATMSWVDQYLNGKVIVHVDTSDLSKHVDALGGDITRLTAGLIVTGMIVGTAIVASQIWQLQSAGQELLPFLAVLVFIVLLFIGAFMVWRMMSPRRKTHID